MEKRGKYANTPKGKDITKASDGSMDFNEKQLEKAMQNTGGNVTKPGSHSKECDMPSKAMAKGKPYGNED